MAYDVEWLNENEVIRVDYRGVISLEQLTESMQSVLDMVESAPHGPIYVLVDARKTKKVRFSAQELMYCDPLQALAVHHHFRHLVVYGETNAFARYLIMVTAQMRSNNFTAVRTEADAVELLTSKGALFTLPA